MQTSSPNPLEWLSNHWTSLIGWSSLILFLYRIHIGFQKLEAWGKSIVSAKSDLELIKTNHLPHLQVEVEKVNDNLSGLREDIRSGLSEMRDDLRVVLVRMK